MPNSRRRKFSVRKGINGREPSKPNNNVKISVPDVETEIKALADNMIALKCSSKCMHYDFSDLDLDPEITSANSNPVTINTSKPKNKIHPNSSRNTNNVDLISECESCTSIATVKKRSNATVDKDVTASASNIDLFNLMYASEDLAKPWKYHNFETLKESETPSKRITRPVTRDRTPLKREKYLRQHRMKVRSPKRRFGIRILDTQNKTNDSDKLSFSVATEAIDWGHEAEECENIGLNVVDTIDDDERQSDNSSEDMCRICHGGDSLSLELGELISACSCRGTVGRVHVKCLERWLTESGKSRCELCGTRYTTRRVHRYGVPRALVMWILSQNAKQLMVDSLGIMLMSPLAVLAAWLSGRTLAGLMTQETHATPWPLASTFVLACMTLVCYYCWIVSAATRHALSWWIWYRSQYEVRLQLLHAEE